MTGPLHAVVTPLRERKVLYVEDVNAPPPRVLLLRHQRWVVHEWGLEVGGPVI